MDLTVAGARSEDSGQRSNQPPRPSTALRPVSRNRWFEDVCHAHHKATRRLRGELGLGVLCRADTPPAPSRARHHGRSSRYDDVRSIIGLMDFERGQVVLFAGSDSVVSEIGDREGGTAYLIENGPSRIPMWIPADILESHQDPQKATTQFHERVPDVIVVDEFFRDPDEIRAIALAQEYVSDLRYYKGLRTSQRFLWPHLREEFGRLLGKPVTEWLGYDANGVFQQTNHDDPLVWHHDKQQYAAAIYLTPGAPLGAGTSFWRDRVYGCRRNPAHPLESRRLGSLRAIEAAKSVVYNEDNVVSGENWELVESVAGLYNRLVIWEADLFHSASSYEDFAEDGLAPTRLVQLFFFDAD